MITRHLSGQVAVSLICASLSVSACAAAELSLSQAVDTALRNNPSVAAGQFSAQAAQHAARGAKALANPEIIVAPTIVGESGADSAVLVSQPLEINGSRRVRGQIASHEANAASFEAATIRRDTTRDVKQAYWDVARAQELVRLSQENITSLETLRAAVQRQFDVGTVPGSQVIKTDVELAGARQELAQAQLELNSSKATLRALMGYAEAEDFTVASPPVPAFEEISAEQMVAAAEARRPEIAAAQAELNAARGRIQSAKLQRVPDLAVQARRDTLDSDGESGVAVVVSLPVLDWGSIKADRASAQAQAQSREKQLEAVRNQVSLESEQAVRQVQASSQVVKEYQGGILEKSEQLAQMARTGYERGATSYLEVLEAQRTLSSTRTAYYTALTNRAKALAQLEWATGCELPGTAATEVKS